MPFRLPEPCLCLVTDRALVTDDSMVRRVAEAVAGGVDLVQVREKDLPGGRLVELTETLREAIDGDVLLIVNERADVAAASAADGVQLGEDAISVAAARSILGAGFLVGWSVHSVEGGLKAASEGADFLVVGTMFASRSHPGEAPAGPGLVAMLARDCPLPLVGIGDINEDNVDQVLNAGALGVAVISSLLAADDPGLAARNLKRAMVANYQSRPATGGANPR